ncbi:MAG: uracil-DNA glycosylase [Nitrospira sp.]|nr:uracil-DNA glycosylase [Nitrospira sp.]
MSRSKPLEGDRLRFLLPPIPSGWKQLLTNQVNSHRYRALEMFLDREATAGETILPPSQDIYAALHNTPYEKVKVLLLGQDPYHTPGMAHGLCFSVRPHVPVVPPSLRNIYRELRDDVGCRIPNNGCLMPWARQGVLMLNTVLTVRAHAANSHRRRGWEAVTDRIFKVVNAKPSRVVFVLWGVEAKKKQALITAAQHVVISCAHPSPLSARKFFGSRCFSQVNRALTEANLKPIDWQIPDL